ncbi:MAG: wax ester/triacylglycerol synthase family O-acyltransferase [Actinomycetota bacterium]|nr:wax ester/triacylglycerol synthase family O-acyltransferase [Actinomycetota bacterium]
MSRLERLSVLDELFLHLEGPNTHMHVGGVGLFEGPPPDPDDVLSMVRARLHMVPRFRQKLALVPWGVGRPVWVDDGHFNLEYHVRHAALPQPGDDAQLKRLVARIMSQQLDRSKPLWEIWLVEGLAPEGFALISKTHHCLIDGISGADIMSVLLDVGAEPPAIEAQPWHPAPEPSQEDLIVDALAERLTSPAELVRTIQTAAMDRHNVVNRVLESAKAVGTFIGNSFAAPPSSLNQPVGPHRRFETVLVELDSFKRIKNSFGGTVNDVVLAVVTGGLRRLLEARRESVDGVQFRAMVPVSVRADQERGALGNRLAALWATLPVAEADPVARLQNLHRVMEDVKASDQAVGAQVLTTLSEYAPPTILAQAARLIARQRAFNLVVTNVPGPQFPLYCLGRKMKEVYPVLPLSENTTLGVALFSYNGSVGFGLLGDYDSASDIGVLAEGIEKSLAELMAAL